MHTIGWTIFDRLYMLNGTLYIVSDEPETVPELKRITSTGAFIENGPEAQANRVPTDKDMRVLSTEEAKRLFGVDAARLDGVTVSRPVLCGVVESNELSSQVVCQ